MHTPVALTIEKKKELFIALPYLGNLSFAIRTCLQDSISKTLLFCTMKVIFKFRTCHSNFLCLKGKMFFNVRSNVVYKFSCNRCSAIYYGETCQHLNVRVGEHSGVSLLTRKMSKSKTTIAIKDHMLFCDHVVSFEDFKLSESSN